MMTGEGSHHAKILGENKKKKWDPGAEPPREVLSPQRKGSPPHPLLLGGAEGVSWVQSK